MNIVAIIVPIILVTIVNVQSLAITLNNTKPICLYVQGVQDKQLQVKYIVNGINSELVTMQIFDPYNIITYENIKQQKDDTLLVLEYDGKYRICFSNKDTKYPKQVYFDINLSGSDRNYASKSELTQAKKNVGLVDADFRWITMRQKDTFAREQTLNTLMELLYQRIRFSIAIKLIIFLTIVGLQTYFISKILRSHEYQVV